MSTVKSYVKEVLARITGDKAEVVAQKNFRKASAAIRGQLAALESKQVNDEERLEEAQEALENAKYPIELIENAERYVEYLSEKQFCVESAQEDLNDTKASITFYKGLLEKFEKEVAA